MFKTDFLLKLRCCHTGAIIWIFLLFSDELSIIAQTANHQVHLFVLCKLDLHSLPMYIVLSLYDESLFHGIPKQINL